MADMTQPEMPERASIPDSEYQPPKKTAEPTHIGITIHRDARATFVPTDLKAHDMGDDVPFSPVDRTSVERLRDEAARLTVGLPDSPQSIKAPPIPLGEPLEPRKEESIPLKVKLAAAVLGVAGAAAGFLGYNKISSSSDEETGIIIPPAPTQIIPKPENPTPTVEVIPTKEPEKIQNYPMELGKIIPYGNVNFALTKDLMEVGSLLDVNTGQTRKEGLKVNDVILNPEVTDAQSRLETAILYGEFLAWQSQSADRSNINFDQFKEKMDNGEDVSFTLYGYQNGGILAPKGEFKVDPRKKVNVVLLSTPSTNIQPFGGSKYGYRSINGELYIELYDYKAWGVGDKILADSSLDVALQWSLALMSEKDVQKTETLVNKSDFDRVFNRMRTFDQYLIPNKGQDYWQGVLNVR